MPVKKSPPETRKPEPLSKPKPGAGIAWEDAPIAFTRRCAFVQEYGDTDTGRTTWALTAPGPIAFLHAREKIDGIVSRAFHKIGPHGNGKGGMYKFGGVFKGSAEQKAQQADRLISEFKAYLADAYTWARTIIVDTHTELWELLRLARFGTLTPRGVVAHLYGPVNAEWRGMWSSFRDQDRTNLIAIGQVREQYRNDKPTGKMEMAGQNAFHYMADVRLKTDRTREGGFKVTIEKGWMNAYTEGMEYEGEGVEWKGADFATLLATITETEEDEWR